MFITLSEKRNEKLLREWSGEITDKHAQDFCDVCNAVFRDYFDIDYMRRKYYEANIYGKSFISVVYKDGKPSAALGAWRNDFCARKCFQLVDFVTLPSERKSGYAVDMLYGVVDELQREYSDALIYAFPGKMSYPVLQAMGFAERNLYKNIYTEPDEDFLKNVPVIDDAYVDAFFINKKNVYVKHVVLRGGGQLSIC